jgi:lipopolysaccharide/colanic/teichoic acid biosynthesis glycosyltransferase
MITRFLDILFSFIALLVLMPLLIPIALLLKFTGEGEIFFCQQRVGKGGVPFGLMKFATMLKNSPNLATGTVTVTGDPRVLPVGRFLRKTKINELPQLLNVIKGDMSLIGPRPQTQRCFDAFPEEFQTEILRVRPGLSGIGSIIFRNEEEMMTQSGEEEVFYDEVIMPYKGLLEKWYVQNRSFLIDVKLLFLTVWVVLFDKSQLHWRLLPDLPLPPAELKGLV